MAGILFLILAAIGVFITPDLRSNPIAVILAVLCILGVVGLAYGKYLEVGSKQAMIDLDKRDRRR